MRRITTSSFLYICLAAFAQGQTTHNSVSVPRIVRYAGHANTQTPHAAGATFSIYQDENGGTALWREVQNVQLDKDGNYTSLLGAMNPEGMPVEIFNTSEPRWLEVEVDQVKMPRVLLSSVPYALKAADADTLGGLPASAYLRAPSSRTERTEATSKLASTGSPSVVAAGLSPSANNGTANFIGMFANNTDLINSVIFQSGNAVSIGGTASLGAMTLIGNNPFTDAAGMALYNIGGGANASVSLDMYNTASNGGIPQAKMKAVDDGNYSDHLTFWTKVPGGPNNPVTEKVRITSAGSVGIGITAPAQKLDVAGTIRAAGGFMFGDGTTQTTAATGSGGGGGTITAVNAGTDLTGGGTTGSVTLNLDTTKVPQLVANNAFAGNQSTTGSWTGSTLVANTGSAAAPSHTFAGNLNTGMFSAGGNTVNIATGGVSRLAVTSNGDLNLTSGNILQNGSVFLHNTGTNNTGVGINALAPPLTGTQNVAVGTAALQAIGSGGNNVAVGFNALVNNANGSDNVAIGPSAMSNATSSTFNLAIGSDGAAGPAGTNLTSGSVSEVLIQNQGVAGESFTIRIGSSCCQTRTFISGIRGVQTGLNNASTVVIDGNGQLGTINSSRRFKEDIQDMGQASDRLMQLRPVTYRYKEAYADGSKPIDYGLIAEEVEEIYPDLVAKNVDGSIQTVQYHKLTPMLLNEVQRQKAQITELTNRNAAQLEEVHSLEQRLAALESLMQKTAQTSNSR